jgi:hypothetical protein
VAFDYNTPLGQELVSQGYAQGYTPAQIAGVLGGAMTESNFDTNAIGDQGSAYGGFQWRGDRQQALLDRASAMGLPASDPRVQAAHFYSELKGPEAKSGFADAQTPQDAATAITSALRPAGWTPDNPTGATSYPDRLKNTLMAYRALSGGGGGMVEGRSGSSGGLTPATDSDNSNINSLLARYQNGGYGNNNTGGIPTGGLLGYFTGGGGTATLGDRLTKLGAAFAVRDKPGMAQEMLNSIRANQKASTNEWKDVGDTGDGKFRKQFNPALGVYRDVPNEHPDTEDTSKADALAEKQKQAQDRQDDKVRKPFQENDKLIENTGQLLDRMNEYRQALAEGNLHVTGFDRVHGFVSNVTNSTDDNDANLKSLEADLNRSYLSNMRELERGASTKYQIAAAEKSILPQGGKFSDRTVLDALDRLTGVTAGVHKVAVQSNASILQQHPGVGNTGLVDPDTGAALDASAYTKRYQDGLKKLSDFEKEQGPRKQQFLQNYGAKNTPAAAAATGPVQVQNADDYNKLPPGATYIAPDGKLRRKSQ